MVMTSIKDVLETRLEVCRWLISRNIESDDNLNEEYHAVERELANLDARSDLDSTRVHVDEESLREWFKVTHFSDVTRYIQNVVAEGPETTFVPLLSFDYEKVKRGLSEEEIAEDTRVGSGFLLLAIFEFTLNAFAMDRSFGLDAYLSSQD